VDLGPQIADLLKQLVKKNVAVEYAGRILSAFKEDAKRVVTDSFHHDPSLPHRSSAFPPGRRPQWPLRSGGHTSQPLPEPLTNRELKILDLLTQQLQNKEISRKLFISPRTVKKHLDNIYGKLNVSGRGQAVEKARMLGMLKR
jgi:ATP/maltotriose-dependent transcriptional regulator MalT